MNILQEITQSTKERIEKQRKKLPVSQLTAMIPPAGAETSFPFEKALRQEDVAFICEIKKASPSKGVISEDFPYLNVAKEYEEAGAAAISVLTEPFYFKGSDLYLREIADTVQIPLLRKDFTVDEYMIYEAKVLGASAVLLICSILDKGSLSEYIKIAHSLGLSALVETHDEKEVETALLSGARIIGVNNRNLKTFEVDMSISERLRKMVPPDIIFVSESGISSPNDMEKLREIRADAALIGESIMRSSSKSAAIAYLRGGSSG